LAAAFSRTVSHPGNSRATVWSLQSHGRISACFNLGCDHSRACVFLFQPVKDFFALRSAGNFFSRLFDTGVDGTGFDVKPAELLQDLFLGSAWKTEIILR